MQIHEDLKKAIESVTGRKVAKVFILDAKEGLLNVQGVVRFENEENTKAFTAVDNGENLAIEVAA